ncbi:hypothetical protein Sru01_48500 [Sphaerisporangium rufum]|uniref:Tetratricopeptide repeat protein n=1 Tax=Sphaerisporangium rufum TaxID=1381558 RepID=A0A919R681_9ACTN|nr:hypothetical protein [Sphaerisporangium rufum]GII79868.1 hypothetical protein Sru01_48500 [Sphaerisporangium rufum]
MTAVARLSRDQPEGALEAAGEAVLRDPDGEWGHRLTSLALERLGRDSEAVVAAREAVRLAPGSWAARLRLGAALRRVPGRWREAWAQAERAVRFAAEQPDPHVLAGDLALLRGDHAQAATAYRAAIRREERHPGARVNLGLALLRWERPRDHHDPAWPVDPRDTARARRALAGWAWQVRLLLAAALAAVAVLAFRYGMHGPARAGGAAVLLAVPLLAAWHARAVTVWRYVPGMLARDLWLCVAVSVALLATAAYAAALATLPDRSFGGALTSVIDGAVPLAVPAAPAALSRLDDLIGGSWAGLFGLVLFNPVAVPALRVVTEAWQGRPLRALAQFAAAPPEPVGRRDTGVTLWIVTARLWFLAAALALLPLVAGERRAALAGVALPAAMLYVRARAGLPGGPAGALRADRVLAAALAALAGCAAALVAAGAAAVAGAPPAVAAAAWWTVAAALAAVVAAFAARGALAWWHGSAGPWRGSLVMCEGCGPRLPGEVSPPVGLSAEVRRAFTRSRGVVLSYNGADGPRSLPVGAVLSAGAPGELRLIVAEDAWAAAERDPRVAVFAADPAERRFWAVVRGIAVPDPAESVLRVTPKHVFVGEYPGRHEARPAAGR